jgi:hypothetical protein
MEVRVDLRQHALTLLKRSVSLRACVEIIGRCPQRLLRCTIGG